MDLQGLSKNKKLLNDLIEKEKGYRNAENTSDNESSNDESWKSGGAGGGGEEVASENGVEDDSKESDKDTENYSQETESQPWNVHHFFSLWKSLWTLREL